MHHARALLRRGVFRQPFDQLVHRRDRLGFRRLVLLGPATDGALEIIARLAVIPEARRLMVDGVQLGECGVGCVIDRAALIGAEIGQIRVPEDPACNEIHDVERRADDAVILAQAKHVRRGEALFAQRLHHPVFAIHRVRGRQQLSRRLAAQHVLRPRGGELVGGVRLPALELLDRQRSLEAFHMLGHPALERRLVKLQRVSDRLGAGEGLVKLGHGSGSLLLV